MESGESERQYCAARKKQRSLQTEETGLGREEGGRGTRESETALHCPLCCESCENVTVIQSPRLVVSSGLASRDVCSATVRERHRHTGNCAATQSNHRKTRSDKIARASVTETCLLKVIVNI